jgi:GNAT superfamily N-acetyltransferase
MTTVLEPEIRVASRADISAIQTVRQRAADALVRAHGPGHWGWVPDRSNLLREMKRRTFYVVVSGDVVVGSFKLSCTAPGFFDLARFAEPDAPATYLTGMAIDPDYQRQRIGRWCMSWIEPIARHDHSRAIRLDAYDHAAGAGPFYERCGYEQRGRLTFNGVNLLLYEKPLG